MRNTWLVIKREYLDKVRTKAFIISTLLMPAFVLSIVVVPSLLMMKSGARTLVVVTADPRLGEAVKTQIERGDEKADKNATYKAEISTDLGEANRQTLDARIKAGQIDGYLWLSPEAVEKRNADYITKNLGDMMTMGGLRSAVRQAVIRYQLAKVGIGSSESEAILKPVDITAVRYDAKHKRGNPFLSFMLPFLLMMMIYMTVLIYGISVMRAVLEEKSSRVIEVLLSSLKPTELMAGKLLGVGAVGLTQMLLWTGFSAIVGGGQFAIMRDVMKDVTLPWQVLSLFPVFFLLGYFIYSSLLSAVGAMTNSQDEAQQFIFPVMAPLIACTIVAMSIIGRPDGPVAFWMSMFPLTAPMIMFLRIAVSMPPWWQILLSIALQVLALWGLVVVCSRIYRVGILMYGKRPTLPEIFKWLRYS
jgi:ABC-2 type transport system permease protein